MNIIGPSTVPWGTPDVTATKLDGTFSRALLFTEQFFDIWAPWVKGSTEHLQAAHGRKINKGEYQLLLSKLDRLGYICQYLTIEIDCLGHYLSDSIKALQSVTQQSAKTCRNMLDAAAQKAISCSQRIIYARNCVEWNVWWFL